MPAALPDDLDLELAEIEALRAYEAALENAMKVVKDTMYRKMSRAWKGTLDLYNVLQRQAGAEPEILPVPPRGNAPDLVGRLRKDPDRRHLRFFSSAMISDAGRPGPALACSQPRSIAASRSARSSSSRSSRSSSSSGEARDTVATLLLRSGAEAHRVQRILLAGSGKPHAIKPPAIIANYIIKHLAALPLDRDDADPVEAFLHDLEAGAAIDGPRRCHARASRPQSDRQAPLSGKARARSEEWASLSARDSPPSRRAGRRLLVRSS